MTGARSEVGIDAHSRRAAKRAASVIAILGALMLGAQGRAEALTYRWINASGGNWFDAANWDVGQVPENGGDVVLPDLGTSYVATLDQGPVYLDSFEIEHGVRFRMGHDFGSPALISSGLIRNGGEIFDASNLLRAPHLHNLSGATISLKQGPLYFDVDLLTNDGIVTLGPNGNAILEPGGNVEIAGTGEILLTGDAKIAPYYSHEPSPHLVHAAGHTIRGENGAIQVPCDNHGQIVGTGNFELIANSTNDGILRVLSGNFQVTNLPNAGGEIFCEGGVLVGSLNNGGGEIEATGGVLQANVTGNLLGTIRFAGPQGTLRGFIDNQGGSIVSGGNLTVQASNVVGGTIDVGGVLFTSTTTLSSVSFTASTDVRVIGTTTFQGSSLEHDGTLTVAADLQFTSPTTLSGAGEMVLDGGRLLGVMVTNGAGHVIRGQGAIQLTPLVNHGLVVADRADLPLRIWGIVNEGAALRATGGATLRLEGSSIDNAGGTITAAGGTFLALNGEIRGGEIVGEGGNVAFVAGNTLNGTTLSVVAPSVMGNSGALALRDVTVGPGVEFSNLGHVFVTGVGLTQGGTLANQGIINIAPGASLSGDGVLELDGGRLQSTAPIVQAAGRAIGGNGTIAADLVNAGTLAPGTSPGTIVIEGDYEQQASGRLEIELAGTAPGAFDRLAVEGQARLDGTFAISIDGGYAPAEGDVFEVMTFASRVGDFAAYEGLSPGGGTIDPFFPDPGVALWLRVRQTGTTPVEGRPVPAALRFYAPRNGQRGELALELPRAAEISLDVLDVGGRKVWSRSLTRDAGVHRVTVDEGLPAGVYFARASFRSADDVTERRARLIVVR